VLEQVFYPKFERVVEAVRQLLEYHSG